MQRKDEYAYGETTEDANFGIPDENKPVRYRFVCAMDNYEPMPRKVIYGTIILYQDGHTPEPGKPFGYTETRAMISMDPAREYGFKNPAIFILDDGHTITPLWTGGWNEGRPAPIYPEGSEPKAILYPYPTDAVPNAVTGEPVDYSNWMLGPTVAYHLKITRES